MNAMQRYNINIICDKIKRYINKGGMQDKYGLITYDFVDISVVCIYMGRVVFTINVRHDEESGVIFRDNNFSQFDFTYNGIEKCVDIATTYIEWEEL